MALTQIDRARIILDLLQDGNVTTEGDYAGLDKATALLADKWAQPLYENREPLLDGNGDPLAWAVLTNDQKATAFLNAVRELLRDERRAYQGNLDADTARTSANATVDSEADTDLGAPE